MMQTIWKFPLTALGTIRFSMPRDAVPLCVQVQNEIPTIWARIPDTDAQSFTRTFRVFGTGHNMDNFQGEYIGTFQLDGGALVFHVFEEGNP